MGERQARRWPWARFLSPFERGALLWLLALAVMLGALYWFDRPRSEGIPGGGHVTVGIDGGQPMPAGVTINSLWLFIYPSLPGPIDEHCDDLCFVISFEGIASAEQDVPIRVIVPDQAQLQSTVPDGLAETPQDDGRRLFEVNRSDFAEPDAATVHLAYSVDRAPLRRATRLGKWDFELDVFPRQLDDVTGGSRPADIATGLPAFAAFVSSQPDTLVSIAPDPDVVLGAIAAWDLSQRERLFVTGVVQDETARYVLRILETGLTVLAAWLLGTVSLEVLQRIRAGAGGERIS